MQFRDAALARIPIACRPLGASIVPLYALVGILALYANPARAQQAEPDSLVAALHATVLDTRPLTGEREAAAPRTCVRPDSAARRSGKPPLGRKAGACHPAFRDAGSPLDSLWPVKGPDPLPGSILPAHRIVAFYGNPLSKGMGILGATPPADMLRKLDAET